MNFAYQPYQIARSPGFEDGLIHHLEHSLRIIGLTGELDVFALVDTSRLS